MLTKIKIKYKTFIHLVTYKCNNPVNNKNNQEDVDDHVDNDDDDDNNSKCKKNVNGEN